MAEKMFLYWGSGSIPCWKAMLALAEKGFKPTDYPNELLEFSKKDHKSEKVTKINPRGQLPTFTDGSLVVNESGAICEYVERKFAGKGTQLLPDDAAERARVYQRMYEISNIDKSVVQEIVRYHFMTPKEKKDPDLLKTKYEAGKKELDIWEGYLHDQEKGSYLVGKSFTMADVFFFPYIAFGVRMGLNLEKFPFIKDYYNQLKDRESVQATWPPHWAASEGDKSIMGPL